MILAAAAALCALQLVCLQADGIRSLQSETTIEGQTSTTFGPRFLTQSVLFLSNGTREDVESFVLSAFGFVFEEATMSWEDAYRLRRFGRSADGLPLVPVARSEVPPAVLAGELPYCDSASPGALCESRNECGTNNEENNCTTSQAKRDVYGKIPPCAADSQCPRHHICGADSGACVPDNGYSNLAATMIWADQVRVMYDFEHNGHCAAGWINSNTVQDNLEACGRRCLTTSRCGYFAYDEGSKICALYTTASKCPDDNLYETHNAYGLLGLGLGKCADGAAVVPVAGFD